jgi:hypothetical protein
VGGCRAWGHEQSQGRARSVQCVDNLLKWQLVRCAVQRPHGRCLGTQRQYSAFCGLLACMGEQGGQGRQPWATVRGAVSAFWMDEGAKDALAGLWLGLAFVGRGGAVVEGLVCGVVQMVGTRAKSRTSSLGAICRKSSQMTTRTLRCAATARSSPGEKAAVRRFLWLVCMHGQAGWARQANLGDGEGSSQCILDGRRSKGCIGRPLVGIGFCWARGRCG